ncbi:MAG: valine--tRNA ligase [Candidatus Cloacimonetes bacterium]|nr:valine--tRNA ligase [Candidatus Cloacimonadota bacterium]
MELNKIYDANQVEKKWYEFWDNKGFFKPNTLDKDSQPFTVLIPPPNVTGILHMGHVLNNTLQDIAIRFNRMKQRPTLWIPGTDHAGIATQNMVEKELAKEKITRHDIGREKLVEKIWEYKNQKGSHIIEQLKQLGCSCDWSREVFTMDENLTEAVKEVFIHLYNKNLIYKGKYIINWCPRCVTALANDEVEHEDKKGKLWYVRYPLENSSEYLIIATTRPETMLGDVAVAVNPNDERYKHLIGNNLLLPIANRIIPIIADDYVDKDFGTGCVKVTPAHDPNDYEIGLRHNLDKLIIMDEHGCINENAPKEYFQLDRFVARKMIIEKLKEENLLEKIDDHENSVGHCYRCDTVVEPYLSDQWFVRMKPLSERAIKVVEEGDIKIYPERWTKVYMHWMNNIRDWCISRQIWWGHRIPAYYCESCKEMIVAKEMPDICPKCGGLSFQQDNDVLDTWFSSWIWPFSTMGWPKKTPDLEYFLPTSLLITAPEIIYLWVARMIMATLEFQDKIPFNTVLLHGIVRDGQGRKMSKSLGNSPDPIDIINNVGADALRFSMVFNTPKGQDSFYSEEILETGRNFCNKIWNAFRFIVMNIDKTKITNEHSKESTNIGFISNNLSDLADQWIYSRLNQVIKDVDEHYINLRFNDAAQLLMQFIWDEFCSWYVEMAKERLTISPKVETTKFGVEFVLLDVMQTSMRLLHPIMPFISEEIWQLIKQIYLAPQCSSMKCESGLSMNEEALIIANFPEVKDEMINKKIDSEMSLIQETIVSIRNLRKQLNISPAVNINIVLKLSNETQNELYTKYQGYIRKLGKVDKIKMGIDAEKPSSSMVAVVQDIQIFLPLEGLIDIEAEKLKLQKQKEKLENELNIIQGKLKNEKFIMNAKPEIITKEKEKELEVATRLNTVLEVLSEL